MCGILGGILRGQGDFQEGCIRRGMRLLRHRGPDAEGLHIEPGLFLAHRRLSILDLDPRADQPMSRQGCVVTFNGEIYNFRALRRELEADGHHFTTTSDTEVLLQAYLAYGKACLDRLEGMFAFAIWDPAKDSLFLARDRFGEKPLFYYQDGKRFLFASEVPPLACLLGSDALEEDPESIGLYFLFSYIPAPHAPFRRMAQIEPGCWLDFRPADWRCDTGRYFDLRSAAGPDREAPPQGSYDKAMSDLRTTLHDCVRQRIEASDVPVATLLSGGIDSSIVTAVADRECDGPLTAYSLGFPEDPEFDETPFAKAMAARLKRVRHRVVPATENVLLDFSDRLLPMLGEPYADSSLIPTSFLCSQIEEKVVLGGDGADELFAGYGSYAALTMSGGLPGWLKACLLRFPPVGNPQAVRWPPLRALCLFHAHLAPNVVDEYIGWRTYAAPGLLETLGLDLTGLDRIKERLGFLEDGALRAIQIADFEFNLPNDMLKKVDYASMFHGIEVRLPYLDSGLVAWALALPDSFRMSGRTRKRVLRDAFAGYLPPEILTRRKHGFLVPVRKWFRSGRLAEEFRALAEAQTYFDPAPLREALQAHGAGRVDKAEFLWLTYVYLKWRAQGLDRPTNTQPLGVNLREAGSA